MFPQKRIINPKKMKGAEVKKLLKANNKTWKEFLDWMNGQTVSFDEDGETDWYDWDVERFIAGQPVID